MSTKTNCNCDKKTNVKILAPNTMSISRSSNINTTTGKPIINNRTSTASPVGINQTSAVNQVHQIRQINSVHRVNKNKYIK